MSIRTSRTSLASAIPPQPHAAPKPLLEVARTSMTIPLLPQHACPARGSLIADAQVQSGPAMPVRDPAAPPGHPQDLFTDAPAKRRLVDMS